MTSSDLKEQTGEEVKHSPKFGTSHRDRVLFTVLRKRPSWEPDSLGAATVDFAPDPRCGSGGRSPPKYLHCLNLAPQFLDRLIHCPDLNFS